MLWYEIGVSDIVLLCYSSSGSLLFTRETGTSGSDYGSAVSVSQDGFVFVSGSTTGALNGQVSYGLVLYLLIVFYLI